MKHLRLLLMALLCAVVSGAWATDITSPWTHTFSTTAKTFTKDETKTLTGVDWTLAVTWKSSEQDYNVDGSGGMKIGSNSKVPTSMTLSTSGISGTIKSVAVTTYGRSKSTCTVGVKVGSTDFTTSDSWGGNTATKMTFAGSASGEIVITWTQGSSNQGAFYVKDITVEFQSADGTYSVTYNDNGATSGSVPTDATAYTDGNNTVTVLGNTGNLAKEHYTFAGWNTATDGTGTDYVAGETFTISKNTTLYAKWAANTNTVTLPSADSYGTYTMDATNPVAYGTEVTLAYNPATGYDDYVATWSVNGETIDGNTFTMPDEAVIVTVSVAEYTQETDFSITLNNAFFGSTATANIEDTELTGKENKTSITIKRNDGNKLYVNASTIRLYAKNTMTITAPEDYVLTSVELVEPSTQKSWSGSDNTSSPTGYDDNTKKWTGFADEVVITFGGTCRIAGLNVKLAKKTAVVNLASACTDGKKFYGTYSNTSAFIVPADLTVSEISVIDGMLYVESYNTGDIVPADTGVLVSSDEDGDHSVTLTTGGTSVLEDDNMLRPSGVTAAEMSAADDNCKYYRLTMHNGSQLGFWWGEETGAAFNYAATGKAYLAVPNDAMGTAKLTGFALGSEDGTTAIETLNIERGTLNDNSQMYNLAGQRVDKEYKGIVVVNGKKYVNK